MKTSLKVLLALLALTALPAQARAETRKFALNTFLVDGVKMWLPSTLVVKKGDEVEITAASHTGKGSIHGFAIDDYKIAETADDKGKVIKFTADKAGIFNFRCQLHPAHIGGQLVVLE